MSRRSIITGNIILIRLLILGVLIRSFIAPGYMLQVAGKDGPGIVFCNGPVAAIQQQNSEHSQYHRRQKGDHTGTGGHFNTTCSFWSASSFGNVNPALPLVPFIATETKLPVDYASPLILQPHDDSRTIRAPPSFS